MLSSKSKTPHPWGVYPAPKNGAGFILFQLCFRVSVGFLVSDDPKHDVGDHSNAV